MKKLLSPIIILILLAGCASKKTENQMESLAPCYHGIVGDSNSVFTVDAQKDGKIKGSMAFVFAQKDSSYGTYQGTYENGKLKATYTFWSEGVQSVGDYEFVKDGDNFKGQGYTYIPSNDCQNYLKKS